MKTLTALLCLAGLTLAASPTHAETPAGDAAPVITITASRFLFSPGKIVLKKGRPVTLVITASDRMHGFSLPDFNLRADATPGQQTELKLTPDKTGRFLFHCDIFCGSGHEDMAGELIVED